jgi:hypothetical protein
MIFGFCIDVVAILRISQKSWDGSDPLRAAFEDEECGRLERESRFTFVARKSCLNRLRCSSQPVLRDPGFLFVSVHVTPAFRMLSAIECPFSTERFRIGRGHERANIGARSAVASHDAGELFYIVATDCVDRQAGLAVELRIPERVDVLCAVVKLMLD